LEKKIKHEKRNREREEKIVNEVARSGHEKKKATESSKPRGKAIDLKSPQKRIHKILRKHQKTPR